MFDLAGMDQSWNSSQWVDVGTTAHSDDDLLPQLDGTYDSTSEQSHTSQTLRLSKNKMNRHNVDSNYIPQVDGICDSDDSISHMDVMEDCNLCMCDRNCRDVTIHPGGMRRSSNREVDDDHIPQLDGTHDDEGNKLPHSCEHLLICRVIADDFP